MIFTLKKSYVYFSKIHHRDIHISLVQLHQNENLIILEEFIKRGGHISIKFEWFRNILKLH